MLVFVLVRGWGYSASDRRSGHVDRCPCICLPYESFLLVAHARASHTCSLAHLAGLERALRGGAQYFSTMNAGNTTGGGGSVVTVSHVFGCIGVVVAACGLCAAAVHQIEKDKAAAEIARIQGEVAAEKARIQGEHKLEGLIWEKELDGYKRQVHLLYSHDYEPLRKAQEEKREKSRGTENEEKKV